MGPIYRGRAYCSRSGEKSGWPDPCANTACDRYATETVLRLADKSKLDIGYADLRTSKCGFVPVEGN